MRNCSIWPCLAVFFKGALSRIFIVSLNSQNINVCPGKTKHNGAVLLAIAILVH